MERANFSHLLTFYNAPSYEILPQLCMNGERFDFIFIDGRHHFDYVLLDFFYTDKLLKAGCCMMFDDLWMPSVRKACSFILSNRNYSVVLSPHSSIPWKERVLRLLQYAAQEPLDVYAVYFSALMALKGSLDYLLIRKKAEDDRVWYHYQPF
jgi:hypothetical protein